MLDMKDQLTEPPPLCADEYSPPAHTPPAPRPAPAASTAAHAKARAAQGAERQRQAKAQRQPQELHAQTTSQRAQTLTELEAAEPQRAAEILPEPEPNSVAAGAVKSEQTMVAIASLAEFVAACPDVGSVEEVTAGRRPCSSRPAWRWPT